MARARNIKPGIMGNEELAELEPVARLLFIYLWMLADREGRLEDRPKRIAAQALPYDRTVDVESILDALQHRGFIARYQAQGKACIQIVAFAKHQTPHMREAASELPSPEQSTAKAVTKHSLGSDEASPRSPDSLIPDSLIPDSLIPDSLIPDSLIPDSGQKTSAPRKRDAVVLKPADVDQAVWDDFEAHRKRKKANLTQTALDEILAEASKAGVSLEQAMRICLQRGWTGFESEWLKPEPRGSPKVLSVHDERAAVFEALTGKKPTVKQGEAIDVAARILG